MKKNKIKKLVLGGCFVSMAASAFCGTYVYISNADDGDISAYELTTGSAPHLSLLGRTSAGKLVMPMVATPDGKILHAAVRSAPFALYSFQIDQISGKLKWMGAIPMPDSMVNISTDITGEWLLATSYGGHKNSVHKIKDDGYVSPEPVQVFPSGGANPHSIVVDKSNNFVYIPQLGTDEIKVHSFDVSQVKPLSENSTSITVQKQYGPRHLLLSPDNKFAYVITEMVGRVLVFSKDSKTGSLTQIQSIASLPADTKLIPGKPRLPTGVPGAEAFDDSNMIQSAEIKMTPNGKYLYTSERTHGTLSGFEVNTQTGNLKYLFTVPTEQTPRGFGIDPDGQYLVATGQKSDKVSLYAINQSTGDLTLIERVPGGKGANWVTFVKTK